jgi:hypothetical protein
MFVAQCVSNFCFRCNLFQTNFENCNLEILNVVNSLKGVQVTLACGAEQHCTDEQHAMSSHELQSALMLAVEFSKMYNAR